MSTTTTDATVDTDDAVITVTDNGDDTVTMVHASGIVRVLAWNHPAVIDTATAIDAGVPGAARWYIGSGRGTPRYDVIMAGHTTASGNVRNYTCRTCHVLRPATNYPTRHNPGATVRGNRNTAECRACRDDRYAAIAVDVADGYDVTVARARNTAAAYRDRVLAWYAAVNAAAATAPVDTDA